jgi:hypothetical protein
MTAKTPVDRLQIEDDSIESQVIAALVDVIPIRRSRLQIASAVFRALEIGSIPHVSFDYP